MKPMMVFHSATVDSNSVGSHDSGTNLDMAAFSVEDLICITAGNTSVELTFDETGVFNRNFGNGGADGGDAGGEAIENSLAILTVTDATTATKVVKDIVRVINGGPHHDGMFLFDAVNDVYPGDIGSGDVSAINIRRTTTTRATTAA
tara:strand:- start:70 stop:510 length:441 start_codon:yes stop_codon:yes gene_type:complete